SHDTHTRIYTHTHGATDNEPEGEPLIQSLCSLFLPAPSLSLSLSVSLCHSLSPPTDGLSVRTWLNHCTSHTDTSPPTPQTPPSCPYSPPPPLSPPRSSLLSHSLHLPLP